jgi:hypothetical protein
MLAGGLIGWRCESQREAGAAHPPKSDIKMMIERMI